MTHVRKELTLCSTSSFGRVPCLGEFLPARVQSIRHSVHVARQGVEGIAFVNYNAVSVITDGDTPNKFDQAMFASIDRAFDLGAVAVGATIYYGSEESSRQIAEVAQAFEHAHSLGMATILWAYLRNSAFKVEGTDYHLAADLSGQANHLGVTIEADIIKQKQPESNGGYTALNFGKTHKKVYTELTSDHPIDLTRYQVINCYMGRIPLINSGGASGDDDFGQAVRTAVINKRAGGTGLISGRKAFQRPMEEGVKLMNLIQDVYLSEEITVA